MPIHIAHPPSGTVRKIQSLSIVRGTAKDTVGDTRAVTRRWNDARKGNAVASHYKDADERGMAYEEVALLVHSESIGTCDSKC